MNKMITTYSMWSKFRNCRKSCELRYLRHLSPICKDGNLAFGSIIHECLEIWHSSGDMKRVLDYIDRSYIKRSQEPDQKKDWHLATAMMKGYARRYKTEEFEVVELEKRFDGKIINPESGRTSRNYVLSGKVDGIIKIDGVHFLLEHKTAGQIDASYLERLWTDFQITLYAWYLEQTMGIPISGVFYNILQKARLQQSSGETEAEFEIRRAGLIAKSKTGKSSAKRQMPETDLDFQDRLAAKYTEQGIFHREILYLSRDRFSELQKELWELTQSFNEARRRGVFYRNNTYCFHYNRACSYYPLCSSGENPIIIDNLYEIVPPNQELVDTIDSNETIF